MWGKEVPCEVMVMSQSFSSGLMLLGHGLGKHFSPYHLWRDWKATRVWGLAMVLLSRSSKTLKGFIYSICFCCRTDFELMGKWSSPSSPSQSKRKLSTLDWGCDYRKWSFPPPHTHTPYLHKTGSFLCLIEAVTTGNDPPPHTHSISTKEEAFCTWLRL